ncbi:MAG: Hsp20/alpha crystallin family protein [Gammaproteobacteria bacterium]|nr:Hsp20/alpha crystallin family protein [Pseudomonadales bacterium]MCP5345430.1 Hsp20/alpha crystallin family protein [Pseudomonadales bacterium]
MNLIPRNQLGNLDSLFDDFFTGFPVLMGKSDLARSFSAMRVDIHEDDAGYEITAELPGVKKEDISVTLKNHVLTINASKETASEKKKHGKVIRQERSSGAFSRSFSVDEGIRQEDIKAAFSDGVLTLTIPRKVEDRAAPDSYKIDIG